MKSESISIAILLPCANLDGFQAIKFPFSDMTVAAEHCIEGFRLHINRVKNESIERLVLTSLR